MIRITALNDRKAMGHSGDKACVQIGTTKEALESEAIALYNKGLSLRNQGHLKEAIQTLLDVLNSPFLEETSLSSHNDGISRSAELLKYSAYKNLAEMSEKEENLMVAMEYYIEAVAVDSTDVTVWCKMGHLATSLENFSLARHSFEMGLQCNPSHWPCLDNVISLLYALNNYEACLQYIADAMKLDPNYSRGLVLMQQIFSEHPGLRAWSHDLFVKCSQSIYSTPVDEEEMDDYIGEALTIRRRKQELSRPPEIPSVSFIQPLTSFRWKNLGECLLGLYKHVSQISNEQSDSCNGLQPRVSLASHVDLSANVSPSVSREVTSVPSSPPTSSVHSQAPEGIAVGTAFADSIPTTPTQEPLISLSDIGSGMDGDQAQYSGGRKRGRKRKSLLTDEPEYKRRSARVKNPAKNSIEEPISCEKMLHKFLPKALLASFDSCQPTADRQSDGADEQSRDISDSACSLKYLENEEEDVEMFLKDYKENNGVVDLITRYLLKLADRSHLVWPIGLADIFTKLYHKLRKHITYPNYFGSDNTDEQIRRMAKMNLLHKELKLDRHVANRISVIQPSSRKSPVASTTGSSFGGKHFDSDVEYLFGLSSFSDKLGEFWLEFCIRVYWLQARLARLQDNMDLATYFFEKTSEFVQMLGDTTIILSNCTTDKVISLRELERQLDSLRKCQSMEELRCMADSGRHSEVIDFLLPIGAGAKDLDVERMKLLQESVVTAKEFKRGLVWAEDYFHKTLHRFKKASTESQKDTCKDIAIQILHVINQWLQCSPSVLPSLPGAWMFRLSQDLLEVINLALDVPDGSAEMAFDSVTPWIILYHLIRHFEISDGMNDDDDPLASSLNLLIHAHEYLGRHSWCMSCEGELPLFIVEVFAEELSKYGSEDSHPFEEDLDNALQQCFYCLYGHRTKKARYLDDHNVAPISLTLDRCQRLFDFFKPRLIPEYDSYKMNAISAELEVLLRRIFLLIPPVNTVVETEVCAYIDGQVNNPPSISADLDIKYPLLKEIYYLLADYYFKSKEQVKAIKFYMYDICINPARFDSWAGMALARSSRLESKLNSHDLKQESSFQKLASATLRCFKRAMELDDSNVKLWIEYGSSAYQLHSHASRLLKQAKLSPLSQEMVEQATSNKTEMLVVSLDCYNQAFACALESGNREEQWLLHYMLAKIAEKMNKDPCIYLDHYRKAIECLHEDKAKYPKKISYFSPPHLSVESLEMYYRIHVCIVKFLLKYENDLEKIPFDLFEAHVKDAGNGPLITFTEKKHDKKSEALESKECKESTVAKGLSQTSRSDHNYSKPDMTSVSTSVTNTFSNSSSEMITPVSASVTGLDTIVADQAPNSGTLKVEMKSPDGISTEPVGSLQPSCETPTTSFVKLETASVVMENVGVKTEHVSEASGNENNADVATFGTNPEGDKASIVVENTNTVMEIQATTSPAVVQLESKSNAEMEVGASETGVTGGQDEVACKKIQVDVVVSVTSDLPANEETSSSRKSLVTFIRQKSDSEALEDLISTLAAVQKSIETENTTEEEVLLLSPVIDNPTATGDESNPAVAPCVEPENNSSSNPTEKLPECKVESVADLPHSGADDAASGEKMEDTAKVKCEKESEMDVEKSPLKRFLSLMDDCMKALNLCQTRFPENFRSVYRLAYVHLHSLNYKDVGLCKELLLGGSTTHFGIFHERKQNNFFNGLWRNPVQDLDRWGSFNAHLNRALLLLFEVLVVTKDSQMLFNLHQHLCRAPIDIAKKYLRDADRINLARMAFVLCCNVLESLVVELESAKSFHSQTDDKFLLHICAVRQQSHKLNLNVDLVDGLLVTAYRIFGLSLDFMQNQFLQMQFPRLPQPGPFDKEVRQHVPLTSAVNAAHKWSVRPSMPSAVISSVLLGKQHQFPSIPVQRPPLQVEETPKLPQAVASDFEVIDLSSSNCTPANNPVAEETSTKETECAKPVPQECGAFRSGVEAKKCEKPLNLSQTKDFLVAKPLTKPIVVTKPIQTAKFVSNVAPFQANSLAASHSPYVSQAVCSDVFLKSAVAAAKMGRLSGEALKFFNQSKPLFTNKPVQTSFQSVPHAECSGAKVSLPQGLLSNIDLLSTLPQSTRDLLVAPRRKLEQKEQAAKGSNLQTSVGKLCAVLQPGRSHPTAPKVTTISSLQSDPSSSSLSESEDDDIQEVIELSSAVESD